MWEPMCWLAYGLASEAARLHSRTLTPERAPIDLARARIGELDRARGKQEVWWWKGVVASRDELRARQEYASGQVDSAAELLRNLTDLFEDDPYATTGTTQLAALSQDRMHFFH